MPPNVRAKYGVASSYTKEYDVGDNFLEDSLKVIPYSLHFNLYIFK